MKQLFSWTILLLFLVNLGGFFYVYKYKEFSIREEVKEKIESGISDEELQVFVITSSNQDQFEWKHSKEFEYKNIKYDVVSKTINPDGSIIVNCISDIEETKLDQKLNAYINQQIKGNNNGKHPVVEFHTFLSHLFLEEISNFNPQGYPTEKLNFENYFNLYSLLTVKVLFTPPQVGTLYA